MPDTEQVPFLAIILGEHQPTEADREMLRQLYATELGPTDAFELEHFLKYGAYGYPPTPNDEAIHQCARRGSRALVILVPKGANYVEMVTRIGSCKSPGCEFKIFFRP